jgi:hypothetical protein
MIEQMISPQVAADRATPAHWRKMRLPAQFAKKNSAARGSPPAATGVNINRICSLPETFCCARLLIR